MPNLSGRRKPFADPSNWRSGRPNLRVVRILSKYPYKLKIVVIKK